MGFGGLFSLFTAFLCLASDVVFFFFKVRQFVHTQFMKCSGDTNMEQSFDLKYSFSFSVSTEAIMVFVFLFFCYEITDIWKG